MSQQISKNDLIGADGLAHRMAGQINNEPGDSGTFDALAIPYTETYELNSFYERFETGCVTNDDAGVPILRDHNTERLVGRATATRDNDGGRYVSAKLSTAPLGEETRTLLNDGTLTGVSVGFKPVRWRVEEIDGQEKPLIIHEQIEVREYSLTAFPAYKTAEVLSSRNDSTKEKETLPVDNLTRSEFEDFTGEVTGQINDLVRRAENGEFGGTTKDDMPDYAARAENFESFGDWVKSIASTRETRHDEAMALYRDLTTGDIPSHMATSPGWIGDLTRKIVERRRWINRFSQVALPSKGMTVDYIKTTATAKVAEQPKELDYLVKGGQFTVETASSPVRTFGGAQTVSQQVIDRSESWVISDLMNAFALQYARETENATKEYMVAEIDKLIAEHKADATKQIAVDVPVDFGAFDWIDGVVDSAGLFEERGYTVEGLAVSPDIFKKLAREAGTDGRPLLTVAPGSTGVNVVGTLNLPQAAGNLMGVTVNVLQGTTSRAMFYDPIAIRTMESPGAPFKLQDQNVLNLSQDFAVYGYIAHMTPYPDAILPVNFTGMDRQ